MAEARNLNATSNHGDLAAVARLHVVGFQILDVLLQFAQVRSLEPANPDLVRLLPVLHHVEANLGRSLSAGDLAHQACLSPSRFYSVFKRVFGVTPMAYVQNARLQLAQRLLITTTLPIAEVASVVGFSSPFYFSRTFHRCFKSTPTAFRRNPHWYRSADDESSPPDQGARTILDRNRKG
jgi:transcriptional regulator GlxA family with amidase domain